MRRALLVTHRSPAQAGGGAARWRSLVQCLPEHGWQVDVVSAPQRASAVELTEGGSPQAQRRAALTSRLGRLAEPAFALAGLRPAVLAPSIAWVPRGAREARRALQAASYDVAVATGPPMAGLLAGLAGVRASNVPFVVEMRDLWAGSAAYDRGGPILPAIERRVLRRATAVIAMTPEACADLRERHPGRARCIAEIPNGYEPQLLTSRDQPHEPGRPLTILHSGAITEDRPLAPIVAAMAADDRLRLVLHGFIHPAVLSTVAGSPQVQVLPASPWADAVRRMREADALLVTQARGAGDATAVASKVYEYLAIGRPVLCVSDGGATEALLRRLGHDALCARLDDPASIRRALDRLHFDPPPAVNVDALRRFSRAEIAREMAALLEDVAAPR